MKIIQKTLKNKVLKQYLIGLSLSSLLITQSMAVGIEPVTNWNLYPIPQEVASTSRGGLTTDKVAIQDGVGAILLYGTSGGQTQTNNTPFNNLLLKNSELLDTTNPTLNGLITNNVITIPNTTLNEVNNNVFIGGTQSYSNVNGTICDDSNATTTGETWLNDMCQGGTIPDGTLCNDGNVQTINDKYVNEVCVGTSVPNGTSCDDNNVATINETWLNGICQGGTIVNVPFTQATINAYSSSCTIPSNKRANATIRSSFSYHGDSFPTSPLIQLNTDSYSGLKVYGMKAAYSGTNIHDLGEFATEFNNCSNSGDVLFWNKSVNGSNKVFVNVNSTQKFRLWVRAGSTTGSTYQNTGMLINGSSTNWIASGSHVNNWVLATNTLNAGSYTFTLNTQTVGYGRLDKYWFFEKME